MTLPVTSLNTHVDWFQLLHLLGLAVSNSRVLPATGQCPKCRRNLLLILTDHARRGQWHWCRNCEIHGDLIQLAATTWDMTIAGTIQRLVREGFPIPSQPDGIERYITEHIKYSERMDKMWADARVAIASHNKETAALLGRLNLKIDPSQSRWEESCGQLIGCGEHLDIEQTVRPNSCWLMPGKGYQKAAGNALFRGRNWRQILMFPYCDLPHRIRSFLFIGRHGLQETDRPFRLCNLEYNNGENWGSRRCGGAFFHPKVLTTPSPVVFGINDPLLSYRLQHRNFRLSAQPLPLVAYRDGYGIRTRKAWQMWNTKRLVFWDPVNPIPSFRQAIPIDGWVSLTGPNTNSPSQVTEYLARMSPADLLNRINNTARPWPEALSEYLRGLQPNQVEEFISQMQLSGIEVAPLLARLSQTARDILRQALSGTAVSKIVSTNGCDVSEKAGCWQIIGRRTSNDELLLNAIIRLDHVIQHSRTGCAYYQGRILWQDQELPFQCLKDKFDRDPYAWVDKFLLDQGVGMLQGLRSWSKRFVFLATQFQQPTFLKGADYIGFDESRQSFMLPQGEIRVGGEFIPALHGVMLESFPATCLEPPGTPSAQELNLLNNPTIWATLVSVLANIMAPVFREHTQGIGLHGPGAWHTGKELAEALGCLLHRLLGPKQIEPIQEAELRHGWPIIVESIASKKELAEWLDPEQQAVVHNCLVRLDWHAYHTKLLLGGWHLLRDEQQKPTLSQEIVMALRRLVPSYLQDVATRRMSLVEVPEGTQWWYAVHADLMGYVKRHHGSTSSLASAKGLYSPSNASEQADGFGDLVADFVLSNESTVTPAGFSESERFACQLLDVESDRPKLAVPKLAFATALYLKRVLIPDRAKVTYTLASAGVLIEDRPDEWVVDYNWWLGRKKLLSATQAGMLRLCR